MLIMIIGHETMHMMVEVIQLCCNHCWKEQAVVASMNHGHADEEADMAVRVA